MALLEVKETNCEAYFGLKLKNKTKDGFLVVTSSNAGTELVWLRLGSNSAISHEEMV